MNLIHLGFLNPSIQNRQNQQRVILRILFASVEMMSLRKVHSSRMNTPDSNILVNHRIKLNNHTFFIMPITKVFNEIVGANYVLPRLLPLLLFFLP
jgi:hypothetical protein